MTFRQATQHELRLAVGWAAQEGWNPGVSDADAFWVTDPEGYVCAERDGALIATGSVVRYGKDYGFMGLFIVRPDLRGQGIGRDFWYWRRDLLRSRLEPGAAIGMDGVFNMQPFYSKGGFVFSHRNLRMEGTGGTYAVDGIVSLTEVPFEAVAAFDRRHFGFDRATFLQAWIHPEGGLALGVLEGDQLAGMGVIRPCRAGFKIGPLFANDPGAADQLFRALSNHAAGRSLYLDIPENNPDAVALAERHRLNEVFGCARMYLGEAPATPWKNIFGITTFELG